MVNLSLKNEETHSKQNTFVLEFAKGDIEASAVEHLREEINAVLTVAKKMTKLLLKSNLLAALFMVMD